MLRLRAGARIVYKLVDRVDERVSGHGTWWDMHTALTVREEEFLPNYRRMWEGIPEEEGYKADLNLTWKNKKLFRRARVCIGVPSASSGNRSVIAAMSSTIGTAHSFHFMGGKPLKAWLDGVIRGHGTGRIFTRARRVAQKSAQPGLMEGLGRENPFKVYEE